MESGRSSTRDTRPGPFPRDGNLTAAGEILVAIDENGSRAVLFPTAADDSFSADTSTKVHVTRRTLRTGERDQTFVVVNCSVARLHPVFATLAAEMIWASADSPTPGATVRRILDEWRDLLSGERREPPTQPQLVGLAAELMTRTKFWRTIPREM